MDPTVLEDIRIVEKWHRKLMTAGVCSDVYSRYAECMRRGLASWEQQQCVVYTEDVKAAENYHNNGTWSSCLNRYMWFVMGGQGAGLFFDDGGPSSDYINFWLNVNDELRQAVEREAFLVATMCTANYGVGPEELGSFKGRDALTMLDEVFAEASSNARELVEKWAAQEYDKQEELLGEKTALGSVRAELSPVTTTCQQTESQVKEAVYESYKKYRDKYESQNEAIAHAMRDNMVGITYYQLWRGKNGKGEPGTSLEGCKRTLKAKGYDLSYAPV